MVDAWLKMKALSRSKVD